MPSHPDRPPPSGPDPVGGDVFQGPPDDWALLVGLPRGVLVAAAAGATIPDAIAGLATIAAGRTSPSPLVRAVARAIYAERALPSGERAADVPARSGSLDVLARSRRATALLRRYADPADTRGYVRWLLRVAESVDAPVAYPHPVRHSSDRRAGGYRPPQSRPPVTTGPGAGHRVAVPGSARADQRLAVALRRTVAAELRRTPRPPAGAARGRRYP